MQLVAIAEVDEVASTTGSLGRLDVLLKLRECLLLCGLGDLLWCVVTHGCLYLGRWLLLLLPELHGCLVLQYGGDGDDLFGFVFWGWAVAVAYGQSRVMEKLRKTYMLASNIQSRPSSPSSDSPGPLRIVLKYLGCHSMPFSVLFAVSSRWRSSILDFSSVAAM